MKAVVAAFNQEKALVGAFSVITTLRMELFEALHPNLYLCPRWQSLIEQFRHENFRLHQLSSQCMFTVALQSGLAALKTPQCYKHNFVLSGGSHDMTQ